MSHQPHTPIEDVVRKVGNYPLAAFAFVQECIGIASERIHGQQTADEKRVAHWMVQSDVSSEELLVRANMGQLPAEIAAALERMGGPGEMNRHISGRQLCWAIRDIALERWGLMARSLLASWNITASDDIGTIVFALVDHGWLQKQPDDRIDDFDNVFTFADAFDKHYRLHCDELKT
jgi:uncharacterized repeat protein (TIGR04138 family)